MGEIRIVGPGETRGYPFPVCKKNKSLREDRRVKMFAVAGYHAVVCDAFIFICFRTVCKRGRGEVFYFLSLSLLWHGGELY